MSASRWWIFRVAELFDFDHIWAAGVWTGRDAAMTSSCPGAVVPPERAIRRTRAAVTKNTADEMREERPRRMHGH